MLTVIYGSKRALRCTETVITMLRSGHRVDPTMAIQYKVLADAARIFQRRSDLTMQFMRALALRAATPRPRLPGLVSTLIAVAKQLTHEVSLQLQDTHGATVPLLGQQTTWLHHQLRRITREAVWHELRRRNATTYANRNDMIGFPGFANKDATTALPATWTYAQKASATCGAHNSGRSSRARRHRLWQPSHSGAPT